MTNPTNPTADAVHPLQTQVELEGDTLLINMGPQHPSTHGVLRIILTLKGEEVIKAEPVIGYLHRGFEKLAENLTYIQIVPLVDRMDYIANVTNELAFCLAIEKLMKVEVPRRAAYLRVLTSELQRIASHLVWLGTYGLDLGGALRGGSTPFKSWYRERRIILDLFEELTGARMMYNFNQIGGVRYQPPAGFGLRVREVLKKLDKAISEYQDMLEDNYVFKVRTKDIGILTPQLAKSAGAEGPVLRGSGVKFDLRKNQPYSGYEEFKFDIPTGQKGDCLDRAKVRIAEMKESLKIVYQAIEGLPEGAISSRPSVRVAAAVKTPEGEVYSRIESPRGELGVYLVSDGSAKPYRLKWRAPSFSNLSLLPQLVAGHKVADIMAVLGSLDPVFGEVDR